MNILSHQEAELVAVESLHPGFELPDTNAALEYSSHLAANYHIAESNVNRTIKKVEDALMKSRRFTLPKRSITTADEQFNWVIIDATECSIERPKKKSE